MEQKDIIVVLIGSTHSQKDGKITPIPNVRRNIDELRRVFTDTAVAGIPAENIYPILDCTRQDSIEQLYRICRSVTYEKLLLVYYAGHGLLGDDAQLYLAAADSQLEMIMISGMRAGEIANLLKGSRARRKVLILDSCYSGAIMGVMSGGATDTVAAEITREDYRGVYAMASASDMEQARFNAEDANVPTYFTGTFIDVLNEGLATGNELISLDELFQEVRERLVSKGLPRPVRKISDDAGRFFIAYNKQYKPKVIRSTELTDDELEQLGNMLLQTGNTKFQNGDFEGALAEFRKAQRLLPDQPDAAAGIANCEKALARTKRYTDLLAEGERLYGLQNYSEALKSYEAALEQGRASGLDTTDCLEAIAACKESTKVADVAPATTIQSPEPEIPVVQEAHKEPETPELAALPFFSNEAADLKKLRKKQADPQLPAENNKAVNRKQPGLLSFILKPGLAVGTGLGIIVLIIVSIAIFRTENKPVATVPDFRDTTAAPKTDSSTTVAARDTSVLPVVAVPGKPSTQTDSWRDSMEKVAAKKYKWGYGADAEPSQLRYMKVLYALGKYYEDQWKQGVLKDNTKAMTYYMKILSLTSGTDSDLGENDKAIAYQEGVAKEIAPVYMDKYKHGKMTKQQLADWLDRYAPGYQSAEQLSMLMFGKTDHYFLESNITASTAEITMYLNPYFDASAKIDAKMQTILKQIADLMMKDYVSKARITGYEKSTAVRQQRQWDRVNAIIMFITEKYGVARERFAWDQSNARIEYNGVQVDFVKIRFPS
ncbi:caspase, EACC1-associated type [Chitinophagaceae bacterium MMS25-I14]